MGHKIQPTNKQNYTYLKQELFEIELFWHLTVCKQNCIHAEQNGLKLLSKWLNLVLNDPKRVDMA